MSYKLYKVVNLVNQKIYIGITKLEVSERWNKHLLDANSPLHRAIQKYGKENFTIEILKESLDRLEISSLEDPTIEKFQSRITQHGYNVAKGGYGGNLGEEVNRKRRETFSKKTSEEKQSAISKRNITIAGRNKSNHAGKLRQATKMIGNKFAEGLVHTSETKQIISNANSKPKSDETRQKMSSSAIMNNNGQRFTGRRVSCLCCHKNLDIGNYTQHIKRIENELQ